MGFLVGIGQITGHLLPSLNLAHEGKIADLAVAVLGLHFAVIQAASINASRGTRFKTHQLHTML